MSPRAETRLGALLPYHLPTYKPTTNRNGASQSIVCTGPLEECTAPAPRPGSAHAICQGIGTQRYLVCKPNKGEGGDGPGAWASNRLPIAGAYDGASDDAHLEIAVPKIRRSQDARAVLNVRPGLTAALAERWHSTTVCPPDGLWLYACTCLLGTCTDDSHLNPLERTIPLTSVGWLAVKAMTLGRFIEGSAHFPPSRRVRWRTIARNPPPWDPPQYDFDTQTVHLGGGHLIGIPPHAWRLRLGQTRALTRWVERNAGSPETPLAHDPPDQAREKVTRTLQRLVDMADLVSRAAHIRTEIENAPCIGLAQ